MDQEAFRRWHDINPCSCPYEHTILTNRCHCPLAKRLCVGEREAVECQSPKALSLCQTFLDTLRDKARFALKGHNELHPLPHITQIRLQVGGLHGLQRISHPDSRLPRLITDIHGLLNTSLEHYPGIDDLPWTLIIHELANYQDERKGGKKRPNKPE